MGLNLFIPGVEIFQISIIWTYDTFENILILYT